MGSYINTGNEGFQSVIKGEYIDKSGLIAVVNSTLNTERRFSCVSRCRRFGKSIAAKMLCAYYDHSCHSRQLFEDLEIAQHPSFEEHLNKHPVIYLDMSDFMGGIKDETIVGVIQRELRKDLSKVYPEMSTAPGENLMHQLLGIVEKTGQQFILIIDEWDAICREFPPESKAMDEYVNWLRSMFKGMNGGRVFAGVYMTGILPIKKYSTQSALNNFVEYSMVEPMDMGQFFGFTKDEVRALASKHGMDFDEMEKWYDGYQIGDEKSMFNPNSVMMALKSHRCRSYWASTSAFDGVADYIKMDFEGLHDDIVEMLGGGRCKVNPTRFVNDMSIIRSKDDVLTVLIHLGYLGYNWRRDECYIPNREVAGEMENAVAVNNWKPVVSALQASERLLQALLRGDEQAVAQGVAAVHTDSTSILSYNDENSLACVISLAFYYARNDYHIHREYATGSGFADLVLIPRKNVSSPAIIIELKVDKHADTALDQIRRRQYPQKVADYSGTDLVLCGISYDRDSKEHTCRIETFSK